MIDPVVTQSTCTGEEVMDAIDLRAFGRPPRTWLRELRFAPWDYVLIGLGTLILVGCLLLRFRFGIGEFWVPEFIFRLVP